LRTEVTSATHFSFGLHEKEIGEPQTLADPVEKARGFSTSSRRRSATRSAV
jgi:hypothetical protein